MYYLQFFKSHSSYKITDYESSWGHTIASSENKEILEEKLRQLRRNGMKEPVFYIKVDKPAGQRIVGVYQSGSGIRKSHLYTKTEIKILLEEEGLENTEQYLQSLIHKHNLFYNL